MGRFYWVRPLSPKTFGRLNLLNGQVEAGVAFWRRRNHRDGRTIIRRKRFISKYSRRRRVLCDRIVLKIPTWPRSVACQLATMGCSHPPSFCCPTGELKRRPVETRGGGETEKKKTIIRLPLMAPGSTRHAATTLR